jgi:pilus assembly protein CpaE
VAMLGDVMEAIITCSHQSIADTIRVALHNVARECSVSDVPPENIRQISGANLNRRSPLVVFFGSTQFTADELLTLEQLCAADRQNIKVIAVSQGSRPDVILKTIRCGAVDYLDLSENLEDELRTLLVRIHHAQDGDSCGGRLITVLSPAGGTGASLLATNLAAVLAQRQPYCGLFDLQLRGGDLAIMLKSNPRHTFLSLASKTQQLDRAMFDQSLIKHPCGIHLLASPEPFSDYRQISPQLIQKVLQLARSSYPNVVVDLEDAEHTEQVQTLAQSTHIIIPLRLDFVALHRAAKCIDHLVQAKVARDHITLVANRTGRPKELPLKRVAEVLGLPIEHSIPDAPSAVNASFNIGVPLVVEFPKTPAAMSIVRLADALMGVQRNAGGQEHGRLRKLSAKAAAYLSGIISL